MIALVAAPAIWLLLLLLEVKGYEKQIEQNFPSFPVLTSLRESFLQNLLGVSQNASGLVAGLTIGERSQLDAGLAGQMRALGLTHLVAVSGANLAIIAGSIYFLAAKLSLPRNLRFALSATLITVYVLLVGPESSVIRAYAMTIAVLISFWIGRGTYPVIALSWAVLLILLVDPSMATNLGFALSASATLGLLVLARPIFEKTKHIVPAWLALGLAATFSAQVYTWPIVLLIQPGISSYSILANLLVEPVVAPVTILGVSAVLLVSFFPWLAGLVTFLASFGTYWIELVSNFFSNLPAVRLPWVSGWLGIFLALLLAVSITMLVYQRQKAFSSALLISTLLVALGYLGNDLVRQQSWLQSDWDVVMCDVGQGDALVLRSQDRIAVIDVGRDEAPINSCLEELGVEHIELLVLSHFDKDHAGGIKGALAGRTIGNAIVSGFSDDRPLVQMVSEILAGKSITATKAQPGLSGSLGSANWEVLAPTATAVEAVDSNDASVVMTFEFEQFSILLLGDLGEQGQERLLRYQADQIRHLSSKPTILKVSHHGSADQSKRFHQFLGPDLALISVGLDNEYGHPKSKTLDLLSGVGSRVARTDSSGAIGLSVRGQEISVFAKGRLSQ